MSSASSHVRSLGIGAPKSVSSSGFEFQTRDPVSSHSKPETRNLKLETALMFFRNVIPIPRGNFYDNFAGLSDHRLASQARVELQVRGHVEAVGFVVVHLGEIFRAFFNPDVAGGAGVVAAAGVVEANAVVQRNIQNGLLFAVVFIGQLTALELHGLAFGKEYDFDRVFAGGVHGSRPRRL